MVIFADVLGDDLRRAPRRYCNHGDIDGLTRVNITRAQCVRLAQMRVAEVSEPDTMAALTQGEGYRGSDQSGSDDQHPPCRRGSTSAHWTTGVSHLA